MKMTAATILAILVLAAATTRAAEVSPTVLDGIGDIVATGALYDPLCACGSGLELFDAAGHRLAVAIGPGWDGLRSGFRIGAIAPGDSSALSVPVGSRIEARLLDLMWGYLDRNYTYEEQLRMKDPEHRGKWHGDRDRGALYLMKILLADRYQIDLKRWLDHNVTADEQDRIFNTDYRDLETDFERRVFRYVCMMRGGSPTTEYRFSHGEVGGDRSELIGGGCQ